MSQWNTSLSVTFNDNDGKIGFKVSPDSASDLYRHQKIFGRLKTRWLYLKKFWQALRWLESYSLDVNGPVRKLWDFNPEIPE